MRMKTVMNHSQDGGLLKMIRRTVPADPTDSPLSNKNINSMEVIIYPKNK